MSQLPSAKGRILIGDDIRAVAFGMAQVLKEAGYEVEMASDGEECLAKALETLPELIVLDIMMPRMHGIDVLKALRADHRTVKTGVLVCTAKDFRTDHAQTARLGVLDMMVKPIEPSELLGKVEAFFAQKRKAETEACNPAAAEIALPAPGTYHPPVNPGRARFTLWGVRGSTPTPGAGFLRHGGNTSCMSVVYGDEQFIFDAGSGIRELGFEILASPRRKLHLFITHTHWDHIQGFPFFSPAYIPGFEIIIYGAEGFGKDLKSVFRGQLDRDYFPVQMEDMCSHLQFKHLAQNPMPVESARIYWEFVQHPGASVGYKIEIAGKKIAWVPDNEFLQGYTGSPRGLTRDHPLVAIYGKMIDFLSDADIVIHEAQYTPDEYLKKVRWGHSSMANACLLMKLAGVRRWIITHHDPIHDDAFLENKLNLTREILDDLDYPMIVSHGYDGLTEVF